MITHRLLPVLFALAVPSHALGDSVTTTCQGRETAATTLVYLHGLDQAKPTTQEQENRKLLTQLADELGFRLAIARSSATCGKQVCWPQKTPAEHRSTFTHLVQSAKQCMSKHTNKWGVLGFSNGGYFASKVVQYCYQEGPDWVISSGSAGSWTHTVQGKKASCPPLSLLIGQKDITRIKAQRYAKYLESVGFTVSFEVFPGKHELKKAPLAAAIKKYLTP